MADMKRFVLTARSANKQSKGGREVNYETVHSEEFLAVDPFQAAFEFGKRVHGRFGGCHFALVGVEEVSLNPEAPPPTSQEPRPPLTIVADPEG
jgi:hypothetical protein